MNKKVLIPVIASIVALLAMLGVSYAYFTATINGTNTEGLVTTATLGEVGYTTSVPTGTNVLPGWSGEGTTSVYLRSSSDKAVKYQCTVSLQSDSYSTNVYIQTTGGSDAQVPSMIALTTAGVVVSEGILAAEEVASGNHGTSHNVTYNVVLRETGLPQNADQEKNIKVESTCILLDNAYSNFEVLSGIIYDGNGNPIANQPMVVYSEPTYFTTDENGHYSVTVESGSHTIYFVPGMSMADLRTAGDTIKTNASAKSVSINTETMANDDIIVSSLSTYTVSVTCTNCTSDASSKSVNEGETASFEITANDGYTLNNATITGECTLQNGILTYDSVNDNMSCSVSSIAVNWNVYWTAVQGGSDISYSSSSKPATTYDDEHFSSLKLSDPDLFIRTTMLGSQVQGHEVCLYALGNSFCFGPGYWVSGDSTGSSTSTKLKNDMKDQLGLSSLPSCTKGNTTGGNKFVKCTSTNKYCMLSSDGDGHCSVDSDRCSFYSSGNVSCN